MQDGILYIPNYFLGFTQKQIPNQRTVEHKTWQYTRYLKLKTIKNMFNYSWTEILSGPGGRKEWFVH